ncbi:MAG: nitrite reductase [Bacteroidota bacterium]
MQSFRTEIENPVVEQDIIELERKIRLFKEGKIDEERFRSLRLARGVYGQRQPGVQMIRIKLPYGKMTTQQLRRISAVADEYSNGHLHATTRQDIQIHYVSLDRTPELWSDLEKDDVTLREACGNTVRNVTASPLAGVDPDEPFDVTPYAHAFFEYFLRNPICQEMGRKFKVSFSSSERDSAFSFMHDLGFIPEIRRIDGVPTRGFKVMLGGGLGGQPMPAQLAFEFLAEDRFIPFAEAVLRVFDRHGERAKRFRARMKFLIKGIGLEAFTQLVEEELAALEQDTYVVDLAKYPATSAPEKRDLPKVNISNPAKYDRWVKGNLFPQKQEGFYAVGLKLHLGNIDTDRARQLADIVDALAGDDIRITVNQGIMLRHVHTSHIPYLFNALDALGLAQPGFDSTADITACPGTDTCNLAITSSTGISKVLEDLIEAEFPDLIYNRDLLIKISGCMNGCGQHSIAAIGLHGSSQKSNGRVVPSIQVMLGGGVLGGGDAQIAEKVIKLPTKRGPEALRNLLSDYQENSESGEIYAHYFTRQGKKYFYELLKPLADLSTLKDSDFVDWGRKIDFIPEIGVGECAGVVVDLVATLFLETDEKIEQAEIALKDGRLADSVYHTYAALVNGAKAILVDRQQKTNTQAGIIKQFQELLVESGELTLNRSFPEIIYQIKENKPSQAFAASYLEDGKSFSKLIQAFRNQQLEHESA